MSAANPKKQKVYIRTSAFSREFWEEVHRQITENKEKAKNVA